MPSIFNFFKTQKADFSILETDMHSHLIPGIDDGAKTLEKSIQYIRSLSELGYKKVITTPHVMGDFYPNSAEEILAGLEKVRAAILKEKIAIELHAAAEYFVDDYFTELLDSNSKLLTLPGNRLLIEFSTLVPPNNFLDVIFRLKTLGYQPVLAHPERYVYWGNQFENFEKIKTASCELQVNLLSIIGHYGAGQKKLANKLLDKKMIDFAGTDLHHGGHVEILRKALKTSKLQNILKTSSFKNSAL